MAKPNVTKENRVVFVIMPFVQTPTRNKNQLTAYFEDQIKHPIENGEFKFKYSVQRSDNTFNITDKIITDLFHADIVICDLSGIEANPNVMYELGIRLAFSNKPVILVREGHKDNKTIFDVSGFYTHPYDPLNYHDLIDHFAEKLKSLESAKEIYRSPVLNIIKQDTPLIQQISILRAMQLLDAMEASIHMMAWLFSVELNVHVSKSNKNIKTPAEISGFIETLDLFEDNREEINKIDWSNFRWSFGSQPAVDYYLSNLYLYGLIPKETEMHFTAFLIAYHAHFVGTTYFQGQWASGSIWQFLGETKILQEAITGLKIILNVHELQAKAEVLKRFKTLLESTRLPVRERKTTN